MLSVRRMGEKRIERNEVHSFNAEACPVTCLTLVHTRRKQVEKCT